MKKLIILIFIISTNIFTYAQDFSKALWQGNLEEVKSYVNKNPDCINKVLDFELSPFQIVTTWGQNKQIEILEFLLEKGTDINFKNPKGKTALHYAAESSDVSIVNFLLEKGADKTVLDNLNQAPLYYAVIRAEKDIIDLLYDKNIILTDDPEKRNMLLLKSATSGHELLTYQLIRKGADIKSRRSDMGNFLHCLAEGNLYTMFHTYIKKDLDINSINQYFYSPLHLAVINNNKFSVYELIKLGANVNQKDNLGKTPYFFASEHNFTEIKEILIKAKADTNIKPNIIKGDYFGMPKPGDVPEVFAPGIVSTMKGFEFAGVFSPDNKECFFTQRDLGFGQRIRYYKRENKTWSKVGFSPFWYNCFEYEPFVTNDGKKVFYGSRRPLPGNSNISSSSNIWMSEKIDSDWGEPQYIGNEMMFVTISNKGTLYTTDLSPKYMGLIKREYEDGLYKEPESLKINLNKLPSSAHPYIAPDESYVIFDAQPNGFEAGAKFYISFRKKDETWTDPVKLPDEINTGDVMCANVSHDGKYFFFNSNRGGYSDIYWVSAKFINKMKSSYSAN